MSDFVRLLFLACKIYTSNRFFLSHYLFSVCSMFLLQLYDGEVFSSFFYAVVFGNWVVILTGLGLINYQRFLGTLPYILVTKIQGWKFVNILILPSVLISFGGYLVMFLAGLLFMEDMKVSLMYFGYGILFLLGSYVLVLVLSLVFLKTVNAIFYEQLITFVLLFFAGYTGSDFGVFFEILLPFSYGLGLASNLNVSGINFIISMGIYLSLFSWLSRTHFDKFTSDEFKKVL